MNRFSCLWARLSLMTCLMTALSVLIMVGTIITFEIVLDYKFYANLPPEVEAELNVLEEDGIANEKRILEIYATYDDYHIVTWNRIIFTLSVGGLLALTLVSVISSAIARRITQPISDVANAANRIVQGNLSVRVESDTRLGGQEISGLVQNFNQLTESLEISEKRVRQDMAAIAHELRTPLTILIGRLQGIRDGVFEAREEEYDRLLGQTHMLAVLIEDLRTVSLGNAGAIRLNCMVLDLADAVGAAVGAIKPRLQEQDMVVLSDLQPVKVHADGSRIQQITTNLLENALRYASDGQRVEIVTGREGDRAFLEISDCGPGFPDGNAETYFEAFKRGDESRSRATGGSGLGLAVVATLVKAHGGDISASNRSGGGACFRILMPMAHDQSISHSADGSIT
ncbi:ATP-binding protein [Coralliovum pocilloporae]|uniref:ATP-binding protein n=1 Tax=Coralliovum pocilloporae TaxID=3066369 RepID=UPI00330763C6